MDSGRRYTIAELADASAEALDALGIAARNGQVRDRPDIRTIRYYSTLGLLDPPAQMTGRTARYSDRHLLQVLAVKVLQARGATLADVQRALVGASDEELRRAIGPALPELPAAPGAGAARPGADAGRPDGHAFWRTLPAHAPAEATASSAPEETAPDPSRPRLLLAVPLAEDLTLLIGNADPAGLDPQALRNAAAPLLDYLAEAGMLPRPRDPQGATS
jgi:DNA-binding transcriptional MerR regulator